MNGHGPIRKHALAGAGIVISFAIGNSGQQLILHDRVLDHFKRHRQLTARSTEAGGQLFARFEGCQIHVVEATGPNRVDKCHRFSFLPNRRKEQRDIDEFHRDGLHFIGDWHTHPQDTPMPSPMDIESITDCFRRSQHNLQSFVLIVIGRRDPPEGLSVSLHNDTETWILQNATFANMASNRETL